MRPAFVESHRRRRRRRPPPLWPPFAATTAVAIIASFVAPANAADPKISLLNTGCSQYNATDAANFFKNLNATFTDLRGQLSGQGKHFATAQQARSSAPVYAMAQCRNYMAEPDCVACYDAAVGHIRNCSAANGARVIYDGCFLRYESNWFYDQTTLPGNSAVCGNRTASQSTSFNRTAQQVLNDLQLATPKTKGYYAAVKEEASADGPTVYAVAQCAETVTESGCQDCLRVAYGNINSCPPDSDGSSVDAGCFLRYSKTAFFADNQTTDISPFLGGGESSNNNKAIIGGAVGAGVGLLLILAVILWYQVHTKAKLASRGSIVGATELQGPVVFSYKDLKIATRNFSNEYKLGEGGFGDVYKGVLRDGNIVAVKKLALGSSKVKADFESEVRLISNVHHRNIIRLLGCCNKGPELLLVYDYMAKGSLDNYLYGEKQGILNWKQRFNIIYGTARGLAYLHEQYHVCIIHRDIKSSNILLDDDFQPKICDFGLARLLPENQSHVSTGVVGTLGYTAPEYAIHGQLTEKVDTYSFGIVVLEIISGRRCNQVNSQPEDITEYLLEQAWKLYENDMHLKLVDVALDAEEYTATEAKRLIEIALMCTQSPASSRPTMSEVVLLLSEGSRESVQPTKPTSIEKMNHGDSSMSTKAATVSFTEFAGR